jgi:ethanolamine utilization protein EutA
MARALFEACGGADMSGTTRDRLRLPALPALPVPDQICFSGGVSEYILGREPRRFGDLGPVLADEIERLMRPWGPTFRFADQGIRATVIGASQYSVQLSGNTIFVDPTSVLPLHNLPVAVLDLSMGDADMAPDVVARAIEAALVRLDLGAARSPVAVFYRWQGPATHARIDAWCAGLQVGMAAYLALGLPLILVGESDVGGLLGLHLKAERILSNPVVSIDGIALRELDFIDIGEILQVSGGVPVVVKSLVFPSEIQAALAAR